MTNKDAKNPWKKRVLWLALLAAAFIGLQWPMLKGTYYKQASHQADVPKSAVVWQTDFEGALAQSAQTGKPILLDFTASWCPPCLVMKREVWPDQKVGEAVNGQSIPLLLDIDLPQNKDLAARYGVRAIPTLILVDQEGKILRQGGFMSAAEVIDFVSGK